MKSEFMELILFVLCFFYTFALLKKIYFDEIKTKYINKESFWRKGSF